MICSTPQPLQQHPILRRALARCGASVQVAQSGPVTATVLRRAGIRLISRGPVWPEEMREEEQVQVLRSFAKGGPLIVTPASETARGPLRKAGFRQILTPTHVAVCSLAPDHEEMRTKLAGSWRNALRQGEEADLNVSNRGFKFRRDSWLLAREEAQRQARRYKALPVGLVPEMARVAPDDVRIWAATRKGQKDPIAAILIIRHGAMATYHIGWTSDVGRRLNAHRLLLFRAMIWLGRRGVNALDLGTLDTQAAPGLARFKLGTGAASVSLGGTWLRIMPPLR